MILLVWIAGMLFGLAVIVVVVGKLLPAGHIAQRSIDLGTPRAQVWLLVSDPAGSARWRRNIREIKAESSVNGRVRYVEIGQHEEVPYEIVLQDPPRKQVVRVIDDGMPYGGTWTWTLEEREGGTHLSITENGFVRNPVFRVMSRTVFRPTATIDTYLRDLAKELGEPALPGP